MTLIEIISTLPLMLWAFPIILSSIYYLWFIKTQRIYKLANKIPFPKHYSRLPIIGHAHHLMGTTEENFNVVMNFESGDEPIYQARILHRVNFVTSDPKIYEVVLNSPACLGKSEMYDFLGDAIGHGLLTSPVEKWKRLRRIIAPSFKPQYINRFVDIFSEKTNILIKTMEKTAGTTIDIFYTIERSNIDLVVESLSGYTRNTQTSAIEIPHISRLLEITMVQIFNVFYHIKPLFRMTSIGKEMKRVQEGFFALFADVITRKEEEFKHQHPEDVDESRRVFLDVLMENHAELTDAEVVDQMNTMVVAALDTGSTAIAFALIMLAMHPEVQEKVYQEVIDVIGSKPDVEYEDLAGFVYMEKALKESMRLFPIAALVARKVTEDVELENCTLPKGSEVVMIYLKTHRSPKYYKDPMKFDPERFVPEEVGKRHPYSFMAFSGGPRNCLGMRYAMMLMKTQVALLVRRFHLYTDYKTIESIRLEPNMVLKATLGYPMSVKLRKPF